MAKAPKVPITQETAKLGDIYTSSAGIQMQRVQSPYSNDGTTIDVVHHAAPDQGGRAVANAPKPVKATPPVPAPVPPADVEAHAADPALSVPAQATMVPGVLNAAVNVASHVMDAITPDDSIEDTHKADLALRQTTADQNAAADDEFHASLAAPPPPAPAPTVPSVEPQPSNFSPVTVAKDIGRGVIEAPDMAGLGVRTAVKNMMGFADHIGDLIEEHVPTGIAWTGKAHHLDSFGHVAEGGDGQNHMVFGSAAHLKELGFPDTRPSAQLDREFPVGPNDHPHSVTGGLVEGASQFATGMATGARVLGAWRVAAGAGAVVKGMAEGAFSDFAAFDAHQARLSDYLKKHVPDAIKPVFNYLASDPRDGEVEGRFKNAIEGLGIGAAAHGIITAARQLRQARMVQRAAALSAQDEGLQGVIDAPQKEVEAEAKKFHEDLVADVGDVNAKGFVIKRKFPLTAKGVAATADAQEMGANTIGLNYAKISNEADMQAAAVQFYDAFHGEITDAKRGVQSIDKQVSDAFGVDVAAMLGKWQPGTAMASHELTALRFAQAAALKDFLAHARAISAGDASLASQAAFLQTGGVLDAMTRAVEGGKAEAARTLRSLRETVPSMVGDTTNPAAAVEFYRKVDALVAGAGGREMVQRAAKSFLTVAKANPEGVGKFNRFIRWYPGAAAKSRELLNVFMSNGLLSVAGNTANAVGNATAMVWEPMMRGLAPHLSNAVGVESHVADGEWIAMLAGQKAAFGDIFRLGKHVNGDFVSRAKGQRAAMEESFANAKSNTKAFSNYKREEVGMANGDTPIGGAIERGPQSDTALGRVAQVVWGVVKVPGHANGLMDDFTKIISGRAELHAQAYRQAMKDSQTGLITADQVGLQMQKHIEDPTADMLEKVVAAQKELSWTRDDGAFSKAMTGLREWTNSVPVPLPLGTSILPFVRTPANVFSYGVRNSAFAPISQRWWAEMGSADGATRQLALTKYAAGSLLTLWVMDHVANGDITGGGPKDPAEKAAMSRVDPVTGTTMWQPYSVRLGDRWFEYSRLDPAATPMAIASDMSESWLRTDWTDSRAQDASEAFATSAMGIGSAFMNKSTTQGLAQLMDAMASTATGDVSKAESFMEKRATGMVPFSSVLGSARRATDPYQREVTNVQDAFKNLTPGVSSSLPKSFDLWGRPRTFESHMGSVYDFLVPARTHTIGGEPADREMIRLGYAKQMPGKSISLPGGLNANLRNYPSIYNEILTRGGPPALQEVNDLVTGASPNSPYYDSLSDGSDQNAPGSKARYLKGRLDFYYNQATQSVKRDFSEELHSIAAEQAGRKADARLGQ